VLLTQAVLVEAPPQIVALSASLDDLRELGLWLMATKARILYPSEPDLR
jgi:replicative superfamily II helicase